MPNFAEVIVMARRFLAYLTFEVLIRVVADLLIVNISYLAALFLRLLSDMPVVSGDSLREQAIESLQIYGVTCVLLTVITLLTYSVSGFYSRGRLYQSRFKALAIFQAVSASYVAFACVLFFLLAQDWALQPPRSALLIAWAITLLATAGARLWSSLWRIAVRLERPSARSVEPNGKIRNVLVIGGAGYIGSVLCRQLLNRGYTVRVLDSLLYGKDSLSDILSHPHFQLMEGDSREVSAVFRAMLDMDAVIHLGELVGDPACALDKRLTLEVNVAATRMVAEAAKGCGVKRFLYASSCSVYGANTEVLDECSELNPVSLYAQAKIGSEQTLLGLNASDFNPVILRFATIYGLSPRPRFDLVINVLTAKAVLDQKITIFGGDQWRPFIHVTDVAGGLILCLESPLASVKGQIFNLGSDDQNYTLDEIGDLIQELIPGSQVVKEADNVDKRDYRVSFSKIRRELGFEPQMTVGDGVRELADAIRSGKIQDVSDIRYSNYKTLSEPRNHHRVRSRKITSLYSNSDQPPPLHRVAIGS